MVGPKYSCSNRPSLEVVLGHVTSIVRCLLQARPTNFVVALTVVLFSVSTYGQLSSASVTGLVRDSSGSVVPNCKLVLKNVETSVERIAESNSAGNYLFLGITPGNYTIEASAPGFQTQQMRQITLAVNQTATIDVTLQVGNLQQTVTVEARTVAGRARIAVTDEGDGIPPRERERVWDSFYRLERHANSAVAGSGIGLFVVRELARLLGGDAWIEECRTGGARVVVELAAPAESSDRANERAGIRLLPMRDHTESPV